jgi:Leucine-rich repeat (LRR) protein
MSELNKLFGPAMSLPASAPHLLNEMVDSIASFPAGERVPSMRVWCDPTMTYLYLDGLKARELHFENLIYLGTIDLYGCPLERFPAITHLTGLTSVNFYYNTRFRSIPDLSPLVNLETFNVEDGELEDASGIVNVPSLKSLGLAYNHLTQVPPLDNLTALENLYVPDNQLTVLPDLSALSLLKQFYCYGNQLTALPALSHMTALESLQCQNNPLTELPDLSELTALRYLYCNDTLLAALPDLTGLGELYYLVCNDSQLTQLSDLTGLSKLRYVRIHNNHLAAEAIDAALIQLAASTTASNGQFNYSGNPGSANNLRSPEAATAKTTLTGKGWTITV